MRKIIHSFALLSLVFSALHAEDETSVAVQEKPAAKPFTPFTGRVTRNKVRLRLQPNLEGPVLRELAKEELLVIVNETGEFYVAQPKLDLKGYIFRTYVLDNVVEGNRVNVRLEPNTDAPIVAQLNAGDRVEGTISAKNNKWLEILLPTNTSFYICKDYVEKVGDASMMERVARRRNEVNLLLDSTKAISAVELDKPFQEINLAGITDNLKKIINDYADMPGQTEQAKGLLNSVQEKYMEKKIAYLEAESKHISDLSFQTKQPSNMEVIALPENPDTNMDGLARAQMTVWAPVEQLVYASWLDKHSGKSIDEFYAAQKETAVVLTGTLEPYDRSVKNKPGDFVIVNKLTHKPIAYVYSTLVNLQEKIGQEIKVEAVARANNNFAYPAYFALTVE